MQRTSIRIASVTLAFVLAFSLLSCTDKAVPGKSKTLLFEITKKGLKQPSYLYGTIHMICEEDFVLTDKLEDCLKQTERLALEVNMSDQTQMLQAMAMVNMKGDTTLRDLLTEEEYSALKNYMEENAVMPLNVMTERMKPFFLATMVGEKAAFGDCQKVSYELKFIESGQALGLEMAGLETFADQMGIFDRIPYKQQAQMLMDAVTNPAEQNDTFDKLVAAYKARELDELAKMMQGEEMGELAEYGDLLLGNRNRNWIPVMEEMMGEKPTFFAVGAGHLPGDDGVIALLKKAGYKVKPVQY